MQAATLLGFAALAAGTTNRAYSLISTAVRLAYDRGLDKVDGASRGASLLDGDDAGDQSESIRTEELRRAWWCVADLENFISTIKSRPRLVDWEKCRTKLPCDDKDWFAGRECPSFYLPANFSTTCAPIGSFPHTYMSSRSASSRRTWSPT